MDFDPDLFLESAASKPKEEKKEEQVAPSTSVARTEESLVMKNINSTNNDVVSLSNLLNITQSHIKEDIECREVVGILTDELSRNIHLMSIKEILEYLKVKLKEREFHVDCIFKAYSFIQKSEVSKEMFIGSTRKERIIEATDRKRINNLISLLNDTTGS